MTAPRIYSAVIPAYLLLCLLMGGSTQGELANMLLQLGAIAILAWSALTRTQMQPGSAGRLLALLTAATVTTLIIQLIPVPPQVWSSLPEREAVARGFDLLGQPRPWLPLSLAPFDTRHSALWLLPPFAILVGIMRLGAYRAAWLAIALLIGTLIGILVGAIQVTRGDPLQSPWYLYSVTNFGRAVGLFANSNHMATLMVATVPFIIALHGGHGIRNDQVRASIGKTAALGGAMFAILASIALNGSLAGIALAVPALAASLFVSSPVHRKTAWGLGAAVVLGLLSFAAVLAGPFQNNLTKIGAEADYSSRYTTFGNGLRAAGDHFPAGSGLGTFAKIYPPYENQAVADRWFVNHVHNDYIEIGLEMGLPGIVLMSAFVLWWAWRTIVIWTERIPNQFGRAASIASGVVLAHSVVDFPLRTSAVAAVFAVCIALLASPRRRLVSEVRSGETGRDGRGGARHLSIG